MVADETADGSGLAGGVKAGDTSAPLCGKQQGGENAKEGGFSRAIRTEQGHGFPPLDVKRNPAKRRYYRRGEGLHKGAPAAARGRKKLFKRIDGNGRVGH